MANYQFTLIYLFIYSVSFPPSPQKESNNSITPLVTSMPFENNKVYV